MFRWKWNKKFKTMCLYPKLVPNPKYKPNKKNKGVVPPITDNRVLFVPVGCGKCIECRKQKKREWQVRMLEDIKVNKNGKFVTLTFDRISLMKLQDEIGYMNDNYLQNNEVATLAVRRFLERWRKKFKKSVRHWLVTELGHTGTERIHLHGIIWTDEENEVIERIWSYGFVWIGNYVNEKTINYIIKYISKMDKDHPNYVPKILCSKGIGSNYINTYNASRNKYNGEDTKEYYVTRTGHKLALPIYYRNKIYSEDEREQLWLQKLDKEERWVMGERIDVSETDDEYIRCREHYRRINTMLGYGDDRINWDEKQYKNKLKFLKLMKLYKEHKLNKDKIQKLNLEIKNDFDTFENDNKTTNK
jgi:hypothetical protein